MPHRSVRRPFHELYFDDDPGSQPDRFIGSIRLMAERIRRGNQWNRLLRKRVRLRLRQLSHAGMANVPQASALVVKTKKHRAHQIMLDDHSADHGVQI